MAQSSWLTDSLRCEVRTRAQNAGDGEEMSAVLLEALAAAEVDYRAVTLDDVKALLAEALRGKQAGSDTYCAA